MSILNFILKFRTLILTEKLLLHLFTGTETLNSDKSDSNQCYSESESAAAHQQQICTTKSATQTEPQMKSWRGHHVGVDADPIMVAILLLFFPRPFPVALFCSTHVSPIPCPTFFPFTFKVGGVAQW